MHEILVDFSLNFVFYAVSQNIFVKIRDLLIIFSKFGAHEIHNIVQVHFLSIVFLNLHAHDFFNEPEFL